MNRTNRLSTLCCLLFGLCLGAAACTSSQLDSPPAGMPVTERVAGNWSPPETASWYDATHCTTRFHRTWLSDDQLTLFQTHGDQGPDPAEVVAINQNYLTIRYPNEERLDADGEPLVWHMVFVGDDSYFWIIDGRADPDDPAQVKAAFDSGAPYHRCPASSD